MLKGASNRSSDDLWGESIFGGLFQAAAKLTPAALVAAELS